MTMYGLQCLRKMRKYCALAALVMLGIHPCIWVFNLQKLPDVSKIQHQGQQKDMPFGETSEFHHHFFGINTSDRHVDATLHRPYGKRIDKTYLVCWYNPIGYLKQRPKALKNDFHGCDYNNCKITFEKNDARHSDAVMYDGNLMEDIGRFKRPFAQTWVFVAHQSPIIYNITTGWWRWYSFNWTMGYDKSNSDIHLPYGEFRKHKESVNRNFSKIAKLKYKDALMVASHCPTDSKRELFAKKLSKYINVDILGKCGKPWNCSKRVLERDECFQLLNTSYKFYLAFENALCSQYFTEKLHENYNYDIIQIVRGGSVGEASSLYPKGTIVSTDDFDSIEELGKHLQMLSSSETDYAEMFAKKSQYYTVGYTEGLYQRALCELCERLNDQKKYFKIIPDILQWKLKGQATCRSPNDV